MKVSQVAACPPRSRLSIATPALVGAVVAAVCMAGYAELAEDLRISPAIYAFDSQISAAVQSWRGPVLTRFFSAITWGASTLPVTLVTVAAIAVLVWLGRHREALLVGLVVAVGTGLGTLAKQVTARPRPPVSRALIELPTSFSFPSGHTLAALLLWSVVGLAVWRSTTRPGLRWAAVGIGLALAVLTGFSRVYLGVHWPSDVLASWLLGTAWLAVCLGGFFTWERAAGPVPC